MGEQGIPDLERRNALWILEELGVGRGFDPETGILPVPYEEVFSDLARLAGFAVNVEAVRPVPRGDHRYTLQVRSDADSCEVTFESGSDYREVGHMLDVLNQLCERVGESRRYRTVDTFDQTVFVIFSEPQKLQELCKIAQLRLL